MSKSFLDSILKIFIKAKVIALLIVSFSATNVFADYRSVTTRIVAIAQSMNDNTANWINPTTAVNTYCGSNAIYIPMEDKEMFAVALSAQMAKLSVEVYYDTAATSTYLPGYNATTTCKIRSINVVYVE